MIIRVENKGEYMYVEPIGKIDSVTSPEFQKALETAGENGAVCIVNFASVPYISSMGLRVIMTAAKANTDGSKLILCGVDGIVKEVFEISGFDTILNISADFAGAEALLKSLAK